MLIFWLYSGDYMVILSINAHLLVILWLYLGDKMVMNEQNKIK